MVYGYPPLSPPYVSLSIIPISRFGFQNQVMLTTQRMQALLLLAKCLACVSAELASRQIVLELSSLSPMVGVVMRHDASQIRLTAPLLVALTLAAHVAGLLARSLAGRVVRQFLHVAGGSLCC